jgi:hypothetical protein
MPRTCQPADGRSSGLERRGRGFYVSGMRNAAFILGVVGGIVGMIVGFFAYGFAALGEIWGTFSDIARDAGAASVVEDPMTAKLVGLFAPILALSGGAMAPSRPAVAAILLVASALGMFWAFDFNVFTMFPIAMSAAAGAFALAGALTPPVQPSH